MPLTSILALVVVGLIIWLLNAYVPLTGLMKTVVNIVLVLIVVGIVLWLINNTYIPMAVSIKDILNIVVVLATCVGILQALGLWDQIVSYARNMKNARIIRKHRIVRPPEPHA